MTYKQLVEAVQPLSKLAIQDLPLTLAYTLDKIIRSVEEEAPFYYARQKEIALKYGKPRESDPMLYDFTDETISIATKELTELETLEVSIKLPALSITITDALQLSVKDMRALESFITFTNVEGEEQRIETVN